MVFPLILQLDVAGNPNRWITYEDGAYYYAKDLIAWTIGESGIRLTGGKSRLTGSTSTMDLNTIIAVKGELGDKHMFRTPTLTNRGLFRRDQQICAYCAQVFHSELLTRDHVQPKSKGGKDRWENVVTACSGCNRYKDDRTPEQANMKLVYVPYAPSRSEHLILMNRNILANQMEFLLAKVPKNSRLHNPINLS